MATVAQLVSILSNRLDEPEHIVRQKLRQLQDDGLLPVARGRAVPAVDAQHVALAIFAVLTSPTAKDATRVARLYWGMEPDGISREIFPPTVWERVKEGHPGTAGEFLTTMLDWVMEVAAEGAPDDEQMHPASVKSRYEFVTSWPELSASIHCEDDGEPYPYEVRFHETGKLMGYWQADVRRSVNVAGAAFFNIAQDLIEANPK